MMNQLAERKSTGLRAWFEQPKIKLGIKNALGGWMNADSFIAQILISLNDQSLDGCSDESKFEAAHLCAALGMLPSLQQVALIPRNDKRKGRIVTVMPQWQGFQALMLRAPGVLDVNADLIHIDDDYDYDPTTRQLKHKYDPFDENRSIRSFDDIKGGYLVVSWKDRSRPDKFHFVTKSTIMKARDCSPDFQRNGDTAIWVKWFRVQSLKTVYRDAYARRIIPIDPLVAQKIEKAVEAEDKALENDPNRVGTQEDSNIIDGEIVQRTKSSRSDQVAASMAGQKEPATPPEEKPDQSEISPEDLEEAQMHATGQEPPDLFRSEEQETEAKQTAQRKTKPKDHKGLHRLLKTAIESGDVELLDAFKGEVEESLIAGMVDEGIYNMLIEQASNALEQAGAPN